MIVEFSTEVDHFQVEGPEQDYLNGEPYSYRGETGGNLINVTAAESKQTTVPEYQYGSSLLKDMPGVSLGDTVHVVVAVYSTGDTFGRDGGQTTVLDAFTDVDKANALRARAADVDDFTFTHDGKEYRADWTGYFEHLDSVEVWGVEVKGFHDYNSWG